MSQILLAGVDLSSRPLTLDSLENGFQQHSRQAAFKPELPVEPPP